MDCEHAHQVQYVFMISGVQIWATFLFAPLHTKVVAAGLFLNSVKIMYIFLYTTSSTLSFYLFHFTHRLALQQRLCRWLCMSCINVWRWSFCINVWRWSFCFLRNSNKVLKPAVLLSPLYSCLPTIWSPVKALPVFNLQVGCRTKNDVTSIPTPFRHY